MKQFNDQFWVSTTTGKLNSTNGVEIDLNKPLSEFEFVDKSNFGFISGNDLGIYDINACKVSFLTELKSPVSSLRQDNQIYYFLNSEGTIL